MRKIRLIRSKDSGAAIILALLAVVMLFIMGQGLLSLGLNRRIFATQNSSGVVARCAADAGLTKAVLEMNEKLIAETWNDSSLPQATNQTLPGCNATFSFQVTGNSSSGYTVTSTGNSNRAQRSVTATLRLKGIFDYAIFAAEKLIMENNNTTTGYNSETGETDLKIQIGTASTAPDSIVIGPGSTIDGNVVVGAGGDPATVIDNEGTIVGLTYAAGEEHVFPTITVPTLPDMGPLDVPGTVTLNPVDSGTYDTISSNGGILEIDGGDVVLHITGDINMDSGSEIQIKPGSSLTIYADADISFVNGAGINNQTGICKNLTLYATSSEGDDKQTFEIKNNSEAFGAVYAPNTDIILKNNASLYGSVTCNSLSVKNNGIFSYDMALRDVSVNDENVQFLVKRWHENN